MISLYGIQHSALGTRHSVLAMLLSIVCIGSRVSAQPVDVRLSADQMEELARFQEAGAVALDPAGSIYVADRGADAVIKLARDGSPVARYGGPGQAEGQFDDPTDIDPTNGLVLVIADAGNGRIQRFSREFLFLEMLPIGSVKGMQQNSAGQRPHYRQREQDIAAFGTGRPIAVETTVRNDMFVLDETERVVSKWDVDRNLVRVIGAFDQGDGALMQPVALTLGSDGSLFVADRGLEAVQVYDAFGSYERTMAQGLCRDARALALSGDALLIALPDAILWFQQRGLLEEKWALDLPESIVDLAVERTREASSLYVLTRRSLYRIDLP